MVYLSIFDLKAKNAYLRGYWSPVGGCWLILPIFKNVDKWGFSTPSMMSTYSRGPKPYFKGTLWGPNKGLFFGLILKKS